MNIRQRHALHVLSSIFVGIMAFCITTIFLSIALFMLLASYQTDFVLTAQVTAIFLISSLVGLIFAILVGAKYYHKLRKSQ